MPKGTPTIPIDGRTVGAPLSPGQAGSLACALEALARKAGNVHPGRSFADLSIVDFLAAGQAIGPALDAAEATGVGAAVLAGVRASRRVARSNANLGILLLLAPLAVVPLSDLSPEGCVLTLRVGAREVMDRTTVADAAAVYEAIRLALPGGLGEAPEQDVRTQPTVTLLEAMKLAADHDLIARQYMNGFADLFQLGLPTLLAAQKEGLPLEEAILTLQLKLLAELGDTLIRRKLGPEVEREASDRARAVLAAGWPAEEASVAAFCRLDAWLRADGNRRNPGASADLVAACLFIALRTGTIPVPLDVPWPCARL